MGSDHLQQADGVNYFFGKRIRMKMSISQTLYDFHVIHATPEFASFLEIKLATRGQQCSLLTIPAYHPSGRWYSTVKSQRYKQHLFCISKIFRVPYRFFFVQTQRCWYARVCLLSQSHCPCCNRPPSYLGRHTVQFKPAAVIIIIRWSGKRRQLALRWQSKSLRQRDQGPVIELL